MAKPHIVQADGNGEKRMICESADAFDPVIMYDIITDWRIRLILFDEKSWCSYIMSPIITGNNNPVFYYRLEHIAYK